MLCIVCIGNITLVNNMCFRVSMYSNKSNEMLKMHKYLLTSHRIESTDVTEKQYFFYFFGNIVLAEPVLDMA
jgi:hypothetical protein